MAESVKEVVPESRPRGQRRGLDRLRAPSDGATGHVDAAAESLPTGTLLPEASPTSASQLAAALHTEVVPQIAATESEAGQTSPAAEPPTPPAVAAKVDAVVAQPTAVPEASAGARGQQRRILVAVIALLAVLVGWLAYRFWDTHSSAQADKRRYEQLSTTDARNQAVLSAARQAAVTLLSYDYRHLDKDFAAVLNGSTGGFKQDFASRQSEAKTLFTHGKAVASGQVLDAAVASSTPTSATVLAVLDQSVKNVSVPNGTVKHYRMQLKLTKVGSSWLVSDVEFPA